MARAHHPRFAHRSALLATLCGTSVGLAQLGEPGPAGPAPVYAIFAPGADPAYVAQVNARLDAYNAALAAVDDQTGPRWPGALGTPLTIRWSLVPDGLYIPKYPGETASGRTSVLFSMFDDATGLQRSAWIDRFRDAMDRWSNLGGATLSRVVLAANDWDDGRPWGYPGLGGKRGDIRIGMRHIDGPGGMLAIATGPNDGDIVLDADDIATLTNPANNWLVLRNVIERATGIALGLKPECIQGARSIMEPILDTLGIDGPQDDDIRGLHRLYGDAFGARNSASNAVAIGSAATMSLGPVYFTPTSAGVPIASLLSLRESARGDYFAFTVTGPVELSASLQQLPSDYQTAPYDTAAGCGPFAPAGPAARDLTLELVDANGTTTLIQGQPDIQTTMGVAGNYFFRVGTPSRDAFIRPYFLNTAVAPACRFNGNQQGIDICSGQPLQLSVSLTTVGAYALQWYHNSNPIPGAVDSTYAIPSVSSGDSGWFSCVASTRCGTLTSPAFYVTVYTPRAGAVYPPTQSRVEGQTATFQAYVANGTAPYTSIQWLHDGQPIAGATKETLSIPQLKPSAAGSYAFSFTTTCNSGTSTPGTLVVASYCYADCNHDYGLSAADFACFLDKFASGSPDANCDGSTTPPVLNAGDFVCFLQKFRVGCP